MKTEMMKKVIGAYEGYRSTRDVINKVKHELCKVKVKGTIRKFVLHYSFIF